MSRPVKLFIVEGLDRDFRFVEKMTQCFFDRGRYEARIINLPAAQNIYMLYKVLKEDEFETDIVEILRDTLDSAKELLKDVSRQDIDEVYMFFDYDIHQNNIRQGDISVTPDSVLREMLDVFDNETENGKLYISYPMVEALYDYKDFSCESFSSCFIAADTGDNYKRLSGENNPNASSHMDILFWKNVINVFYLRISCLFGLDSISFSEYRQIVTPLTIYNRESELTCSNNQIFVLSAFPEYLLDNFREDFWNTMTPIKHYKYEKCIIRS